jgi:hypothetical protein
MTSTQTPLYTIEIEAPANGRLKKATVLVFNSVGKTVHQDEANLTDASERRKLAKRIAQKLGGTTDEWLQTLDQKWNEITDEYLRVRRQAEAGSPEATAIGTMQLLDASPSAIRRPLCLVGGRAYAAAWVPVQHTISQSVKNGVAVKHDPPLVTVEDVLLIITSAGQLYADGDAPNARPVTELGLPVGLLVAPPPGRSWSGAGVKRYVAGERPDPVEVFQRIVAVVNRFLDFARSLAPQETMCELVTCYILSTYLLDAFHVVGYLWPNGERGAGKTSFLQIVVELAYLGQLILAGSSYASLRDMADYGATLAFDDAEAVMDTRRTDPDKRTLLLAGNRRGATVAVKELKGEHWVTRYVNTFCPRLFSAIRLPDEVLGSRSIIVPLVRSDDPARAKANCLDPEDWPCDRQELLDDLWAVGLKHLAELMIHDREAAALTSLAGRNLDRWRPILGVAHWLQEQHGITELFQRMEKLAQAYQQVERAEYEDADRVRVLLRVLIRLCDGKEPDDKVTITPGKVAQAMCALAKDEDLTEGDKSFTSSRKVGYLLKRQRFRRPRERHQRSKDWEATREEIEQACRAYGVEVPGDTEAETDEPVPF